jgi:hypothetical protein
MMPGLALNATLVVADADVAVVVVTAVSRGNADVIMVVDTATSADVNADGTDDNNDCF